jgi:hypothetical protein
MQRLLSTSPEKPAGGLHPCAGRPSTIGPPQSVALFCLVARARHAGPHSANWRTPPQSIAFFCLEPQLATACEMPRAPSFPWLVLRPITSKACCAVPDFSSGQTRGVAAVRAQVFLIDYPLWPPLLSSSHPDPKRHSCLCSIGHPIGYFRIRLPPQTSFDGGRS